MADINSLLELFQFCKNQYFHQQHSFISQFYQKTATEIVNRLDYEEVKQKRIFQKFLESSKRNNLPQNKRKEARTRSQDAPHTYFRMNTISEESSHFNQTPQRMGSKKNNQPHARGLSEESGKKKQSQQDFYNQNYDEDNQYYDDPYHNNQLAPPPLPYQRDQRGGGQYRYSPNARNDYQDYDQQIPYNSPPQMIGKSKSPPQRTNSNRGGDQSASQESQRSQEFSQQNKRQNSQSPGKGQPTRVDNYNRRFPIKDQNYQDDEELVGHSQLVPADNYYQSYQGNRQQYPPYENDGYNQNQRMKTSQSQQAGLDQYQSQPQYGRDNRWYDGDYDSHNQYQRNIGGGRSNSGSNKVRRDQMNYRQPMNYPPPPPNFLPPQYRYFDAQDDRIRNLDQRCADYEVQIQRINHSFDDFKQQAFKDKELNKQAIMNLEDTIQNQRERIFEFQTREDTLKQENEKLKSKINYEQLKVTKLEEDIREMNSLLEDTKDQLVEARREIMKKEDEVMYTKNQLEAQKQKYMQQQIQQDNIISQLREDKDQIVRDLQGVQQNNRSFMDLQAQQSSIVNENKRLYNDIDDLKRQIQDMNVFIEQQKQDIYHSKHQLIEKSQRETQLHQQLENSYSEILQLKGLLQRAEQQLMNQKESGQQLTVQPIPYGGRGVEDFQQSFKTLNQQEQNKRNLQQNNRNQLNNSYVLEQTQGRRGGGSIERLNSQNSPQNRSLLMNDSRGKIVAQNQMASNFNLGSENTQESPINRRKQGQNKQNQQQYVDVKQISTENNIISQQLKNKNTVTPSNFLSWEVAEQNQNVRNQNTLRGSGAGQQGYTSEQNIRQQQQNPLNHGQQSQEQIDKMYKNAKQQMDREQEYVSQQYRSQNQQQQQPSQQNRGQNYERNPNHEYQQLYNDYINDRFKNTPPQNKRPNQPLDQPPQNKGQIDPQTQIKNIENNLMMLNVEKDKLKNELQRLEEAKLKSAQNIRRKNDISEELQILDGNISQLKTKLREMNALHPY